MDTILECNSLPLPPPLSLIFFFFSDWIDVCPEEQKAANFVFFFSAEAISSQRTPPGPRADDGAFVTSVIGFLSFQKGIREWVGGLWLLS